MLILFVVTVIVSAALMVGALWGVYGKLSNRTEGFIVAAAGGALTMSVISELVEPSVKEGSLWVSICALALGAVLFSLVDYWIDEKLKSEKGVGLLAAITFDGVPENLALGVALIGASVGEVAALAGAILLSNVPEAAGGAREMKEGGMKPVTIFALWGGATILLAGAALTGNFMLEGADPNLLAAIRCIAAGAVVASLATEVFPKAYKKDHHLAGVATALGLMVAIWLESFGG
ncbi:ZIP family metal transporter [Sphingorhabdus sp.]|uniref:ZIP family metal transporter n=1 Tax=Sphingorhabdus sp. TaxID=1902408 RepID=UPI00391CA56D